MNNKEEKYELKLKSGKVVTWLGKDGEDAARRYVDIHREEAVIAWRNVRYGLAIGLQMITE